MKKVIVMLTVVAALVSCKKDKDKSNVFTGPQTAVYHGKAWSSLKVNNEGNPEKLTLSIDAATLATVPVGEEGSSEDHGHENNLLISLPEKALELTPFKFIMLNWNPMGHEPAGVYDTAHFDMHFYLTPANEVMNYVDMTKIDNLPSTDYVPANHIAGPGVPMMGKHWIDVTSPELHGVPFTQTFLYGSYNGQVVFYEPMITLDFLKATSTFQRSIPQPAKFKTAGYYPTRMTINKEAGNTNISLEGFVYRQAS
ncbi:MAG TPA: hypothetical protein VJ499_13360 [Flavisolibacter sp.]|nr:hypothetical protein [Flavisolibacter sp.]